MFYQAAEASPSVPPWVTVLVAVLLLVGTFAAALASWRAARSAAGAATSAAKTAAAAQRFIARSDRFADWQMYKRKAYAELLAALRAQARAEHPDQSPSARATLLDHLDVVLLAAYEPLRNDLLKLRSWFEGDTVPPLTKQQYNDLIKLMTTDINQTPQRARSPE